MLHCGGERSISDEVSQLLVNLLDLYAGRVAYPIDEPESMEAKTTVDEVSGRDGRELPTLKCVDDNRAARFQRFGQLADTWRLDCRLRTSKWAIPGHPARRPHLPWS